MTCDWNSPGTDRYTGTVEQAIVAYGLPIATQSELIRNFEQRRFADHVVIDRDTIRGQRHDFDSAIRSMHFGSRGKFCDDPSRSRWSATHVETALVVCTDDGSECIAWPAVCGNVFRVRINPPAARTSIGDRSEQPVVGDAGAEAVVAALISAEAQPWTPSSHAYAPGPWTHHPELPSAPWHTYVPPVTPPIPEPSIWLVMLAGLIAGGYAEHRRKRKK